MKSLPVIIPVTLLFLLLSTPAHASTSINISNNGGGSSNSVKVHNSTGGNVSNGTSTATTTNKTYIEVDGEVLVDETTEGGNETDISVKKEGDNKPEVKYEVKKNNEAQTTDKKAVKSVTDTNKKKASEAIDEVETEVRDAVKTHIPENASLLSRLENLFDKLRSFFGN
jgi:hypothetical protein